MLHNISVEDARERCKKYIDEHCIIRGTKMPGKLPGSTYTWIFYMRRGLFNRQFMRDVGILFADKIEKEIGHFNFQLAGLETGSTPLLAALPHILYDYGIEVHSFSVRKERKKYGMLNWLEGIPNDKPVMLIDDLCNSTTSMRAAHDIITQNARMEVKGLQIFPYSFAVVNKVNKGIHPQKREVTDMHLPSDIKVLYLFDMDDFNLYNPSH